MGADRGPLELQHPMWMEVKRQNFVNVAWKNSEQLLVEMAGVDHTSPRRLLESKGLISMLSVTELGFHILRCHISCSVRCILQALKQHW